VSAARHLPQNVSPLDAALILGASARLTRLITTDQAGDPVVRSLISAAGEIGPRTRNTVADGLACPFCVGFHLSLLVTTSYAVARRFPALLALWRVIAGALAVNYATAHVVEYLDWQDDEGDRAEPSALKERDSS
jgi:hypothetical protein